MTPLLVLAIAACGPEGPSDGSGSGGGLTASGGADASGGTGFSGGGSGGLTTTGGAPTSGGAPSGGAQAGGAQAGGSEASGGQGSGGSASGGQPAAGGQDGSGGSGVAATWGEMVYMLNAGCASCHSPPSPTNLRPEDTGPNTNLHTTLTTHRVKECNNALLVDPGQPATSALVMLLNAECTKNGEPFFMPETCGLKPCFPQDWMTGIELWIEAGAPAQ